MKYQKYDIILVDLNPTKGSEQSGKRPCVVLQNNIANASKLKTVTIAPLSSSIKDYPTSVCIQPTKINNLSVASRAELSQIRTIDESRIVHVIGALDKKNIEEFRGKLILFFDIYDEL